MDLYGQDAELALIGKLVTRLESRTFLDVGAEQGALATGVLDAGVEHSSRIPRTWRRCMPFSPTTGV
jgi:hypothetical protein